MDLFEQKDLPLHMELEDDLPDIIVLKLAILVFHVHPEHSVLEEATSILSSAKKELIIIITGSQIERIDQLATSDLLKDYLHQSCVQEGLFETRKV